MAEIDLLFIGTAADGPVLEVETLRDPSQAAERYGGYVYEQVDLATDAHAHTLSQTPWDGQVETYRVDSDGRLEALSFFEFQVSGKDLAWSPFGTALTAVFRYRVKPTGTSLLKALAAVEDLDATISVLRVGGTRASVDVENLHFESQYPGSRYNNTRIVRTGSTVTIFPTPGCGFPTTHTPSSDVELANLLSRDVAFGKHRVFLSGVSSDTSLTLPEGEYLLTDGTDGTIAAADLEQILSDYDLTGIDVICPVGWSTEDISESAVPQVISDQDYPVLVVTQASVDGPDLADQPNSCRCICSVGFKCLYGGRTTAQYLDDAAPRVAALIAGRRVGISGTPIGLPVDPAYTPETMRMAVAAGHTVVSPRIAGWSLSRAVTGDPTWSVAALRTYQEIAWAAVGTLLPYIGKTIVDLTQINGALAVTLSQISSGDVEAWQVVQDGETLYLDVNFRPAHEITAISARLFLGNSQWTT